VSGELVIDFFVEIQMMFLSYSCFKKVSKQRNRFNVRHVELFPFLKGRYAEIIDDRNYYRTRCNDIYPKIGGEHGLREEQQVWYRYE